MTGPGLDDAPRDRLAELEFAVPPESIRGLPRLVAMQRRRPVVLVWHDTGTASLAGHGLAVCEEAGRWRLERLCGTPQAPALTGAPAQILRSADTLEGLALDLAGPLIPVAAFEGQQRRLTALQDGATTVSGELLEGRLRGVAADTPASRLRLSGPACQLGPVCRALAVAARLHVPSGTLAAHALLVARGFRPPPQLGPPAIVAGALVGDALVQAIGHLTAVMLHWAEQAASGQTPEAVHQMRVAIRRLRSGLSVFRDAAACPEIDALRPALRELAAGLGKARDWDVFLHGTGQTVADAIQNEPRIAGMMTVARRKRDASYAELRDRLSGPSWRELQLALACAAILRPWEHTGVDAQHGALRRPLAEHAAVVLTRRLKHVRHHGGGFRSKPVEDLHELRKDCKRLRYAIEIVSEQFPRHESRRFAKRLAALQESLGVLNDAAVATNLMAQLGRGARSFASGVVSGYSAAQARDSRSSIRRAWAAFRTTEPFWS